MNESMVTRELASSSRVLAEPSLPEVASDIISVGTDKSR